VDAGRPPTGAHGRFARHANREVNMRVDGYTRAVLTVIAVALSVLAATQVLRIFEPATAVAAGKVGAQKVAICSESGDFCASVDETGRLYVK
jgi:hypothetical protein